MAGYIETQSDWADYMSTVTVEVTYQEGGLWDGHRIEENEAMTIRAFCMILSDGKEGSEVIKPPWIDRKVHSIRFPNGDEWDTVNGWRREPNKKQITIEDPEFGIFD